MDSLNDYKLAAFSNAQKKGFHKKSREFGTVLMLIVSELAEAMEGDRKDNSLSQQEVDRIYNIQDQEKFINALKANDGIALKSMQLEIADAFIRLFDLGGEYNLDLDKLVKIKMRYNEGREYMHGGKKY